MLDYKSEDVVRDEARNFLHLQDDMNAKGGVGQLTSFNSLDSFYFKGISKSPDGWYFPNDINAPAIVLETKSSDIDLNIEGKRTNKQAQTLSQIENYIEIANKKYNKVIGILYNGHETIVYKNKERIAQTNTLFNKQYYLNLFNKIEIDIDKIQTCTIRINEILHLNL